MHRKGKELDNWAGHRTLSDVGQTRVCLKMPPPFPHAKPCVNEEAGRIWHSTNLSNPCVEEG